MNYGSTQPEIIALDFYDGATEGFAASLGNLGSCYFKLIAWDENQDLRLFVAVSITNLVFDTILELLRWCDVQSPLKIWLPKWEFGDYQAEAKASKIVEVCQAGIKSKGVLILSNQINGDIVNIIMMDTILVNSAQEAMQRPENINNWLKKLGLTDDAP